jgi:hypothetical protein
MLQIRCHELPRSHGVCLVVLVAGEGKRRNAEKKATSPCPDMGEGFVGDCFSIFIVRCRSIYFLKSGVACGVWSVWAGST